MENNGGLTRLNYRKLTVHTMETDFLFLKAKIYTEDAINLADAFMPFFSQGERNITTKAENCHWLTIIILLQEQGIDFQSENTVVDHGS